MRRRTDEQPAPVPPADAELTSYHVWCAARGLEPNGDGLSAAQYDCWQQQRREAAAVCGLDEDDLPIDRGPWDFQTHIGPIDPDFHDVMYRPDGSIAMFGPKPGPPQNMW